MSNVYEVIRRPIVTEKGVTKKENERTHARRHPLGIHRQT